MKIFVVTEDEVDYDYEENPIYTGVTLVKAFTTEDKAQIFIEKSSVEWNRPRTDLHIAEVELHGVYN